MFKQIMSKGEIAYVIDAVLIKHNLLWLNQSRQFLKLMSTFSELYKNESAENFVSGIEGVLKSIIQSGDRSFADEVTVVRALKVLIERKRSNVYKKNS